MKKIEIEVHGEYADDVIGDFWAWFLDGGGVQDFADPRYFNPDQEYSFDEKYDAERGVWYLDTRPIEEREKKIRDEDKD